MVLTFDIIQEGMSRTSTHALAWIMCFQYLNFFGFCLEIDEQNSSVTVVDIVVDNGN